MDGRVLYMPPYVWLSTCFSFDMLSSRQYIELVSSLNTRRVGVCVVGLLFLWGLRGCVVWCCFAGDWTSSCLSDCVLTCVCVYVACICTLLVCIDHVCVLHVCMLLLVFLVIVLCLCFLLYCVCACHFHVCDCCCLPHHAGRAFLFTVPYVSKLTS